MKEILEMWRPDWNLFKAVAKKESKYEVVTLLKYSIGPSIICSIISLLGFESMICIWILVMICTLFIHSREEEMTRDLLNRSKVPWARFGTILLLLYGTHFTAVWLELGARSGFDSIGVIYYLLILLNDYSKCFRSMAFVRFFLHIAISLVFFARRNFDKKNQNKGKRWKKMKNREKSK